MASSAPPPGTGGDRWGQPQPGGVPSGSYGPGGPSGPVGPGGYPQGAPGTDPSRPGGYGQPAPGGYGPAGPSDYGPGGPAGYGPAAPGVGGPGGPGGPPDYVVGGPGGQPPYREPSAKGRGVKAAVIATVLALVVAGGALAFYKLDPFNLFTAGPQAAEALPADAVFYVGVDLEPSAEQKVAALRFLNHFPAFREEANLDDENADVRRRVFEEAAKDSQNPACAAISYDDDIAPWIGGKFGVAGVPGAQGSDDPDVMVALEVTDREAASAGLEKLRTCSDESDENYGFAFTGDYAVLAETQALAEQFTASAEDASLADDADFTSDMESLGDLGVATMWVDIAGSIDAFGPVAPGSDGMDFLKTAYQRGAATIRFSSDSVEVVTSIYGDTPSIDHGGNQIVDLPESTVFAMSAAGGGERLDASWDDIMTAAKEQAGADIETQISQFEAETGLALPEDLSTMLGDNIMMAIDSEGLTAAAIEAEDPSLFNAGVRFTTDPEAINAIYNKVLALVNADAQQSLPFVKHDADDGIVIASNDGYAERLATLDGGLGDSGEFQSVTDDAAGKEFVLFFNWDSVEEQILQAASNTGASPEVIENLRPLRAFGITAGVEGDYLTSTYRLSVND